MNRFLTYKDINFILSFIYDFEENFNNKTCFSISGHINQFNTILNNFIKNKNCQTLFCIINKNQHWTFLTILKKKNYEFFYVDSFGKKIYKEYLNTINKTLNSNFIFLYNDKKIQNDNYSCGYYCVFFLLIFDILLHIQKEYDIYILFFFVKHSFPKDKFLYFLNKYKTILN